MAESSGTGRHVAVLMGGWSAERDVSLVTGRECAKALVQEGYRVTEVDVTRDVARILAELEPDVAFNALHGPWGEDGKIQGVLEVLEIPYTHSGVLASALAMDKPRAKSVFGTVDLPCEESLVVPRRDAVRAHQLEPPYVIKPIADGSSFGVFIVMEGANRPPAELKSDSWSYGENVMVEKYVPGRELTVAVLGDRALGLTEIIPQTEFYDYEAKYAEGGSRHELPAKVPDDVTVQAKDIALKAHNVLGCRGATRSDFRYDDTKGELGHLVLLEVNTQPGMTSTSLVPEQAAFAGYSFGELVSWIVEDASCDR